MLFYDEAVCTKIIVWATVAGNPSSIEWDLFTATVAGVEFLGVVLRHCNGVL